MDIYWVKADKQIGNGYGYYTHSIYIYNTFLQAGHTDTFLADVALHISVPHNFFPLPGKINIIYTMFESTTLPKYWVEKLQQADAIFVPCKHNLDLFKRYIKKPILVVQEGCDTDFYSYKPRHKSVPFIYLWVGAPNPRKGFDILGMAWAQLYRKYGDAIRLVLKTTNIKTKKDYRYGIEIIAEDYTREQLRDLYYKAHCFVFPTRGEGWGLTLIEAAATGLPCIYTDWSGPKDFMLRDYAYPLKWKLAPVTAVVDKGDEACENFETYSALADIKSIEQRMEQVYWDYETALIKAQKQAEHIKNNFSWEHSLHKLLEAVDEVRRIYGGKSNCNN